MPNTLVHYGIQGLATGIVDRRLDGRWVLWACVLPDVPWIAQRLLRQFTELDPYVIRSVAIVQASLLGCMILAAACAVLARRPLAIFVVLALNAAAHLALDGLERKWGNGVHFLVPLDWTLWNGGLVWPEHAVIQVLSLAGVAVGGWLGWRACRSGHRPLHRPGGVRWGAAAALVLCYVLVPCMLRASPAAHDNHSLGVLTARDARPGRPLALDRNRAIATAEGPAVRTFAGETLRVVDAPDLPVGTVSLRGEFVTPASIRIDALHVHDGSWRDGASLLALGMLGVSLVAPHVRSRRAANHWPSS